MHRAGEELHVQPGARRGAGDGSAPPAGRSPSSRTAATSRRRPSPPACVPPASTSPTTSCSRRCGASRPTWARTPDAAVLLFAHRGGARVPRAGRAAARRRRTGADAVFVAHADRGRLRASSSGRRARCSRGARLLTASYAPAYAGANGPIFSRGAMIAAAIAKVTGRRPVVVGKPSRAALRTIREQLGAPHGGAGRDRRRPRHGHRARPPGRRAHDPRAQRDQRPGRARPRARAAAPRRGGRRRRRAARSCSRRSRLPAGSRSARRSR